MSIEAVSWALRVPVGGNAKVVLLGLANHAHPDGTEAYPALDTLAEYAHCDRSTARRNVRKLVEAGWIREDGTGPKGQIKYELAMGSDPFERGGGEMPSVASAPEGGGTSASEGVAPAPPEPSIEPSFNRSERTARECDRNADPRQSLPDGFPDELRPHARHVFRVLRDVARQHGTREVYPLAVGRVIAAYPRRPLVETAHALAQWAVDPPRPIKDVVGTYRTFLMRERDLAATERLADDGTTTTVPAQHPPGVTPLHRRGRSNAEQVQAQIEMLREAERRLAAESSDTVGRTNEA